MKKYYAKFYRSNPRLPNVYVKTTFLAHDLERAISRIKKDLHRLDLIPKTDANYSNFILMKLVEIEQKGGLN